MKRILSLCIVLPLILAGCFQAVDTPLTATPCVSSTPERAMSNESQMLKGWLIETGFSEQTQVSITAFESCPDVVATVDDIGWVYVYLYDEPDMGAFVDVIEANTRTWEMFEIYVNIDDTTITLRSEDIFRLHDEENLTGMALYEAVLQAAE